MLTQNAIFAVHEAEKQLLDSRKTRDDFKLTPEKIDYEMQFYHSDAALHIHDLTQEGLEHFVRCYGSTYQVLCLDCRCIRDLSPLADLHQLEALSINRCKQADTLWDLSQNTALKILSIEGSKKLTANPMLLKTSQTLEEIRLWGGGFDSKYPLASLACFEGMPALKRIDLNDIKLKNRNLEILSTLPILEEFHFDAGMLTTEEIAWICAKYPHLYGDCLGVYTTHEVSCINDIRICGHRKPGLDLPKDQKRLELYTAQFAALVEKYRNEL